jgi:hypothetical protein
MLLMHSNFLSWYRLGHRKFKVASDKKTNQLFSEAYR